jgi:hypothetical protein
MTQTVFLRRLFLVDAASCIGCFLLLAGIPATLAPVTGLDAGFLRIAGCALLPCAALFLWLGTRAVPPLALSVIAILGNVLWAAESFVLLGMERGTITPIGTAVVVAQALFVLGMALLETYGLRAMRRVIA